MAPRLGCRQAVNSSRHSLRGVRCAKDDGIISNLIVGSWAASIIRKPPMAECRALVTNLGLLIISSSNPALILALSTLL